MAPVSTIPAFKAALYARLQANTSLGAAVQPVQILYGLPAQGQSDIRREVVLLGWTRAEDPTNGAGNFRGGWSTAALGATRSVEERYVLDGAVINVGAGVDGQQACTERGFQIFQAIAASLEVWQAQPMPIDGVVRWALITAVQHEEGRTPSEDFRCLIHFDIACSTRIS